jgi:pseudouridine synthase
VPKTYRAVVAHAPVREEALERLRAGVQLEDGRTRPAQAKRLAPDKVELTLREGRKRQVRRMLEEVGHPVKQLQRVQFGPLRLDVGEGKFRQLNKQEVAALRRPSPREPSRGRRRRSSGS